MANSITRTYTFSNGSIAYGDQIDTEIQAIVNTINNADAGTTSWTVVKTASLNVTGSVTSNLTFSPTTKGIVGTTTNDSAASGNVGEIVSGSLAQGSATSLSTGAAKTICSISLTAGQWDLSGIAAFEGAGTTVITAHSWSTSNTDNTLGGGLCVPTAGGLVTLEDDTNYTDAGTFEFARALPSVPVQIASTLTFYLVVNASFTTSTLKAYGGLWAVRRR